MSGYCSLQATGSPASVFARCTWPSEAAAAGFEVERAEPLAPVGAEFGLHPALDERRAHRRRLALQLHQLLGIVGGQRVGDGREQLRDFHHRALHRPQRFGESARLVVAAAAGEPSRADPRGESAGLDAEPRVAAGAGGESVGFFVARHLRPMVRARPR